MGQRSECKIDNGGNGRLIRWRNKDSYSAMLAVIKVHVTEYDLRTFRVSL